MNSDEVIFPKPKKSNNINENLLIINESNEYFKQNNTNIKLNQSQESLKSNNSNNMTKEDLTFSSFKSGIDEDNFYEEISQILNKDFQFNYNFSNNLKYTQKSPEIERPKNHINIKNEDDENEEGEDLEAELNKIHI